MDGKMYEIAQRLPSFWTEDWLLPQTDTAGWINVSAPPSLSCLPFFGNSLTYLAPSASSSRVIFTYHQETILCPLIVLLASICLPLFLLHLSLFQLYHPVFGFELSSAFRDLEIRQNGAEIVRYRVNYYGKCKSHRQHLKKKCIACFKYSTSHL